LGSWTKVARRQDIRELFAPLPVFEVPLMRREVVGLTELEALSLQLYGEHDPVPPLSAEQPLRFYMDGSAICWRCV